MSEDDLTESPPVSPEGKVSPSFMRKKSTVASKKDLHSIGVKAAAADLDDPSLENADIVEIKDKASDKVNDLIHNLETGSFGAANFDTEFRRVWPYAQGHFGFVEEPKVDSFPELIKSVANHPLARQHGEFTL